MIRVVDDTLKRFMEYLEKEYPTEEEVRVSVLWGYDACCDDDTGGSGFAVYIPPLRAIMIPSDIPEVSLQTQDKELERDFAIHNFAHEYRHFLQDINGEEFDEQVVDDFADKVVKDFWLNLGGSAV
jgi:hypothetical protein